MVGVDDDGLRALMRYADQLALAFQIMDDVRDVEGGPCAWQGRRWRSRPPGADLAGDRMAGHAATLSRDVAL